MSNAQADRTSSPKIERGGHLFAALRPAGAAVFLTLFAMLFVACQGSSGSQGQQSLAPPVESSGIRIAITKAVRQGNQLWLTFRISSAELATPNMWLVGGGEFEGLIPILPQDMQYNGLRFNQQNQAGNRLDTEAIRPPGTFTSRPPYPTPVVQAYDNRESFLITGKPGAKLGVTIRKLRFEKGSTGIGKVISGDWAFSFVLPNNLPTPTPTPTMVVK